MEFNFCRRCGEPLQELGSGHWTCKNKHSTFSNPLPATGIFFIDGDKILVSRRAIDPGKGYLDSVGGFIDVGETAEESIKREILEETGLNVGDYEDPVMYCTASTGYLFEGEEMQILSTFFWSKLKPHAEPVANDDVAELLYVPLKDVDLSEFFGEDVKIALRRLRQLANTNMFSDQLIP